MKLLIIAAFSCCTLSFICSCQDKGRQGEETDKNIPEQYFADDQSAARKAKSDLVDILRIDKNIQLNINVAELEQALEEGSIATFEVDINRFLQGDSSGLNTVADDRQETIVPFINDGKVIGTATLRKEEKGYRVGGLANNKTAQDIQAIRNATGRISNINLYHIPNIDAEIYEVIREGQVLYFTDYGGLFNFKEPASMERLRSVLKTDLMVFERQYGDQVKKGKLVK